MPRCFPQHLSRAAWGLLRAVEGGWRSEEADGEAASLHLFLSLSLLIIWEATFEVLKKKKTKKKRTPLPPSLDSVWVFLSSIIRESAPGHITTRRALCCEFSTRHTSSPPLPFAQTQFLWGTPRRTVKILEVDKAGSWIRRAVLDVWNYSPLFLFLVQLQQQQQQ